MSRLLLVIVILGGVFYFQQKRGRTRPVEPPPLPPSVDIPEPLVLGEEEAGKVLLAAQDTDPQVRWAAIELLYRMDHPEAKPLLDRAIAYDSDLHVRRSALELLRLDPRKEAGRQALQGLKDLEPAVRSAALRTLGDRGERELAAPIVSMLKDPDPEVRIQALRALGRIQAQRTAEYQPLQQQLREDYAQMVARAQERRREAAEAASGR